jgi:hypothetical protein
LTWNLPVEGTPISYKLYRDDALIATVTELTYSDYNIPSGTHRYTLSAVYLEGESVQVGPVVVETTEGVENNEIHFIVYPTITASTLTIESQSQGIVTLYNTIGQQLMEIRIDAGHNLVDISILPDGMYFLKMTNGCTIKIIKNS